MATVQSFKLAAHLTMNTKKFVEGMKVAVSQIKSFEQAVNSAQGKRVAPSATDNKATTTAIKNNRSLSKSIRELNRSTALFQYGLLSMGVRTLVTEIKDFEDALYRIRAIENLTTKETKDLGEEFRGMARGTVYTATDLAEGFRLLLMAGLDYNEAMSLLPMTLRLSTAAFLDNSKAADYATNIMTAYNLSISDMPRTLDMMMKSTASSNLVFTELYQSMKVAAPIAVAYGFAMEDVVAMISLLANRGIKGAEAGNALANALSRLTLQPGQVSKALAEYGIQLDAATIKQKGLINTMIYLAEAGMDIEAIFNVLMLRAKSFGVAFNMSKEEFVSMLDEIKNSDGTLNRMADNAMGPISKAFKELTQVFEDFVLSLEASGTLVEILDDIKWALNALKEVIDTVGVRNLILIAITLKFVTAISSLLGGLTKLIKGINKGVKAFKAFRLGSSAAANAVRTFEASVTSLGMAAGAVTVIIAAMAAAFYDAYESGQEIKEIKGYYNDLATSIADARAKLGAGEVRPASDIAKDINDTEKAIDKTQQKIEKYNNEKARWYNKLFFPFENLEELEVANKYIDKLKTQLKGLNTELKVSKQTAAKTPTTAVVSKPKSDDSVEKLKQDLINIEGELINVEEGSGKWLDIVNRIAEKKKEIALLEANSLKGEKKITAEMKASYDHQIAINKNMDKFMQKANKDVLDFNLNEANDDLIDLNMTLNDTNLKNDERDRILKQIAEKEHEIAIIKANSLTGDERLLAIKQADLKLSKQIFNIDDGAAKRFDKIVDKQEQFNESMKDLQTDSITDALGSMLSGFDALVDSENKAARQALAFAKAFVGGIENVMRAQQRMASLALMQKELDIMKTKESASAKVGEAAASSAAEVSKIPYVGWAMVPAVVAALIGLLVPLLSKQYAMGGIIPGTSYSGDNNLVKVNSGEMILNQSQQSKLFAMANGASGTGAGEVQFRIKGSDLVGVFNKYNRKLIKTS